MTAFNGEAMFMDESGDTLSVWTGNDRVVFEMVIGLDRYFPPAPSHTHVADLIGIDRGQAKQLRAFLDGFLGNEP